MSEKLPRSGQAGRRAARTVVAVLLSLGLMGLVGGCGFNVQTNRPYTPSDGTNADIGTDGALKVRNLVVISRVNGQGDISATLVANTPDQLQSVSVTPVKSDGSTGTAVTATIPSPLDLGAGSLTVLTNVAAIRVSSTDLQAGLTAQVTMQFAQAGPVTLNCPVVDGTIEPWSSVTPGSSASPSPEPTPT